MSFLPALFQVVRRLHLAPRSPMGPTDRSWTWAHVVLIALFLGIDSMQILLGRAEFDLPSGILWVCWVLNLWMLSSQYRTFPDAR